jgi:transcriptional regulator with XRE-family HTH domain
VTRRTVEDVAGRNVDPRFGERMRELLAQRGVSYRALAARTFHAKSYLHDLATGRKAPTPEVARRIDDALDAGGQLAALAMPEIDRTPPRRDTDDVQRRTLLLGLAGVSVDYLVSRLPVSTVATEAATVEQWRETAWEYGFTYMTAPRAELLGDLTADLAAVMAAMDRANSLTARAGLADAAGRIAALAAMCCVDLGYWREARHTWRLARRLADESGSVGTRMWVRGREAVLGLYSGRPVPVVLNLAEQGLAIDPGARNAGRAGLEAAQAQALALLGRRADATAALRATENVLQALPPGSNDTIFDWTERNLRHAESFVYGLTGTAAEADEARDRALAMYAPDRAVSRAQVHLHRAVGAVRDGDVTGGVRHAADVLESLPLGERGHFVLAIADMVLAAVPADQRQRPDVAEYRDLVTSARRTSSDSNA